MEEQETYYSSNKGIKLYPTEDQQKFLDNCISGHIIVYNWALSKEIDQFILYESGESPNKMISLFDLCAMYSEYRKTDQFLASLPAHTMQNAINDVVQGFKMFANHIHNMPNYKNFPTLYSNFKPRGNRFYFEDNFIKIEGLNSLIQTSYHSGFRRQDEIKFINPVISRNNRNLEYTLTYVIKKPKLTNYFIQNDIPISEPIGVDVNKRTIFACSNGLNIPFVDTTRIENHLNKINSEIDKDRLRYENELKINPNAKVSRNSLMKLDKRKKLYEHLANIHRETAYKGSLEIIKLRPSAVILETLNTQSIMSDSYMKRQLQHHPLGIAQRILAEQCFKYGIPVVYAPQELQTSNYCCRCGAYHDIKSNPMFNCPLCGLKLNRDTNAAINLQNWYINSIKN